jgi:MFS family permease
VKKTFETTSYALAAILGSVVFLVLGTGLQNTLLSLRASGEGMSVEVIGLMTTAFFAGYVAGSMVIPRAVATVGHIRTFAGFASLASISSLLHVLWLDPVFWCLLRAVSGACYAGVILVVESWLNGTATRASRGRVLAVYSMVISGSWAGSQQFLHLAPPSGYTLFLWVAILFSLALVPITLGRAVEPGIIAWKRSGIRRLYDISPIGATGPLVSGLCVGAFVGMGPVVARNLGGGPGGVAAFMTATVLGALLMHWPLGWLSDRTSRGRVIVGAAGVSALTGFVMAWQTGAAQSVFLLLAFAFGGATFQLYALSVAHVNDLIEESERVPTASSLILVYGLGAIAGPLLAGLVMGRLGPEGLFIFVGTVQGAFALFCLIRLPKLAALPAEFRKAFVSIPRTSHVVLQLLTQPRKPEGDKGDDA